MSRTRFIATTASFSAALALFVAGPVMITKGVDARTQVRNELRAEKIVTPDDASKPGVAVENAETALVQAAIIKKHAMETTGGKSYSELDRTDPARQTAFNAAVLRTALLSSALAWNVANLVIGLGALVIGLGLVFLLIGFALRKPETVIMAPAAATVLEREVVNVS